jgi:hypothetical protein
LKNTTKLFDWLQNLTTNKKPWSSFTDEDHKSFDPYMIHRFISMHEDYIDLVNIVQKLPSSEKELIHKTYCNLLPKKYVYFKYMRKTDKEQTPPIILNYLTKYFECSSQEVEEYTELLNKDSISNILESMGVDEKEVKKLWKKTA